MTKPAIGGGPKKVLYTLSTVQRMGVTKAAKALTSKNACKACGLGMGGQRGGMTDELGDFPAVCNKSVQAQSSDVQPAIPEEVFAHPIPELRELSGHELEHASRDWIGVAYLRGQLDPQRPIRTRREILAAKRR